MSTSHLNKIIETLRDAERILIATHVFPDGDALGAQIGLRHILTEMGKQVTMYCDDPVSYLNAFLKFRLAATPISRLPLLLRSKGW